MCLVAIAIDHHKHFPLVIASNRDDFFDKEISRLDWWAPSTDKADQPHSVLGGRDTLSGQSRCALSESGRLAILTGASMDSSVSADIVNQWLTPTTSSPDRFWVETSLSGYADFNLVFADFLLGECWLGSHQSPTPMRLERDIVTFTSDAPVGTESHKALRFKSQVTQIMAQCHSVDQLSRQLFSSLASTTSLSPELSSQEIPPSYTDPSKSANFVRTLDHRYGTRTSTLIITERTQRKLVTHVMERTFTTGSKLALLRSVKLNDWPPRYRLEDTSSQALETKSQEIISESYFDHDSEDAAYLQTLSRPVKRRTTSLIKPSRAMTKLR